MSFDQRDIRRAMDVYTLDNVYLGTVLKTVSGPAVEPKPAVVAPARQVSDVNGEAFGPMPTQPIGNPGPVTQGAREGYAAASDSALPLGRGHFVVGKWWGLADRRTIPIDAIQTVSMERVVLKLRQDELAKGAKTS